MLAAAIVVAIAGRQKSRAMEPEAQGAGRTLCSTWFLVILEKAERL